MDNVTITIEGVSISDLKQIKKSEGAIYHAIKKDESSFHGFGEAYFSFINSKQIKAWKIHKKMWLNLIVPVGSVKFVLIDQRDGSKTLGNFFEITINSKTNYKRLTIPPGITFGFKGIGKGINLVLNIANIEHDPTEVGNLDLEFIDYNWENEV